MRQIQVTVPNGKADKILEVLQRKCKILNILRLAGDHDTFFVVRIQEMDAVDTVQNLEEAGVGVEFGIIDIVALEATIPQLEQVEREGKASAKSRILTAEIYNDIAGGARISAEYIIFIITAAIVAGLGLYTDSVAAVVASMVISPIMGPLLAFTFAINVKDGKLARNALVTEFVGLSLGIGLGVLLGLIVPKPNPLPAEMVLRGEWGVFDVIFAFVSGIAVSYSITSGIQSALVGVAISASLMPPAVNAGMLFVFGEYATAVGSLSLFGINFVAIIFSAMVIMWGKRINPLKPISFNWVGPAPNREEEEEKTWWEKIFIEPADST